MVALVVTGITLGDEGKAVVTEFYTKKLKAHTIIRHNGGCQAAHNIVRPDGTHHTFQQFGSGTFEGAETYLSEHMIVHPLRLLDEALALQNKGIDAPLDLLSIDSRALIITPYHQALNQLKEKARGSGRHGSTGLGIGETRSFAIDHPDAAIRAGDLQFGSHGEFGVKLRYTADLLLEKARELDSSAEINDELFDQYVDDYMSAGELLRIVPWDYFYDKVIKRPGNIIFEGAQGVLLDELYGFHPYNTWTDTTPRNALKMLAEVNYPEDEITSIGVLRTYMTRHGAGPLPTEDTALNYVLSDQHNKDSEWTGPMRYGKLDLVLLKYAIEVSGPYDQLAITHADVIPQLQPWVAEEYVRLGDTYSLKRLTDLIGQENVGNFDSQVSLAKKLETLKPIYTRVYQHEYIQHIENELQVPIGLVSYGPTIDDKREFATRKTVATASQKNSFV